MTTVDLTARQQQILALIRQHIADTGFPPTRAEIAAQLGFRSPNAAEEHLKALARKGVIELASGASRGIRVKCTEPPHPDSTRDHGWAELLDARNAALEEAALVCDERAARAIYTQSTACFRLCARDIRALKRV